MRNYPVKNDPIGSSVSDILRYKHTDILLLYYKDIFCKNMILFQRKKVDAWASMQTSAFSEIEDFEMSFV